MESSSAVIAEETAMAKLKPMFMEIYTTHFSQEEVDGITAFTNRRWANRCSASSPP
jgi:hypothetical protein